MGWIFKAKKVSLLWEKIRQLWWLSVLWSMVYFILYLIIQDLVLGWKMKLKDKPKMEIS